MTERVGAYWVARTHYFYGAETVATPYGAGNKVQLHCQISDDPGMFRAIAIICTEIAEKLATPHSTPERDVEVEGEDWREIQRYANSFVDMEKS